MPYCRSEGSRHALRPDAHPLIELPDAHRLRQCSRSPRAMAFPGADLPMLNMEKRTGVKDGEVEDFISRASDVQNKIADLVSGKISVEEIEAEQAKEAEEQARHDAERARIRADYERREAARKAKEAAEEHEKWWSGADYLFPEDETAGGGAADDSIQSADGDETARERALRKYENDYASRWSDSQLKFDDAASVEERAAAEAAQTAKDNAVFEANNPEFCENFKADAEKRRAATAAKEETAAALRLKGNRYFKAKKFARALELYVESLRAQPYVAATLVNICQVHMRTRDHAAAIEYASRALRVTRGASAKALSRRAAAYGATGEDACYYYY